MNRCNRMASYPKCITNSLFAQRLRTWMYLTFDVNDVSPLFVRCPMITLNGSCFGFVFFTKLYRKVAMYKCVHTIHSTIPNQCGFPFVVWMQKTWTSRVYAYRIVDSMIASIQHNKTAADSMQNQNRLFFFPFCSILLAHRTNQMLLHSCNANELWNVQEIVEPNGATTNDKKNNK